MENNTNVIPLESYTDSKAAKVGEEHSCCGETSIWKSTCFCQTLASREASFRSNSLSPNVTVCQEMSTVAAPLAGKLAVFMNTSEDTALEGPP